MKMNAEDIAQLEDIRAGYVKDVEKAERDIIRARARLDAAKVKVSVADEMIAKLRNLPTPPAGVAFAGFGKYAGKSIREAMLDVILTHAGIDGMSVQEIREI